jgi:hypothetical protein
MHSRGGWKALLTAMTVGLVISAIYAVGHNEHVGLIMGSGVVVGACIWLMIAVLERSSDRFIERVPPRIRIPLKGLIYLLGGAFGWLSGMFLSSLVFGFRMSIREASAGPGTIIMAITGGVAMMVGLSFYAYEMLERRLARTMEQLKESEWAEKELVLARSIQSRLLPPSFVYGDGFAIAARNLPASFVAGDFYDIVRLDDGTIAIVVADVAGKGVGASLIMASVKAVLPFVAREGAQRAMSILNAKLVGELGKREFVALAYARFHPADGSLELLNAGFPDPYIVSAAGVRSLAAIGERLPLGIRADVVYEPLYDTLQSGERLVFVSDGIPEAPVDGEPLGYDRLAAMLGAMHGDTHGEAWLEGFLGEVRGVVDAGLADDWTAVVLERVANGTQRESATVRLRTP